MIMRGRPTMSLTLPITGDAITQAMLSIAECKTVFLMAKPTLWARIIKKPKLKQARENMAAEMRQRLNCRLRTFNVSSTLIPLTLSGGLVLDEHQGHHAEHSRDQRDPK
jgi:hypothetical protein